MMRILLGAILGIAMTSGPLLARQEPAEKEKQKQQEPKNQEPPSPKTNTEKKQEPPPSAKQEKSDEKRQQQDAKQQQKETEKHSKDNEKKSQENNQPQPQQQQQNGRQYAQESHPKGERIPPQKFDEHFGSEHHFRVRHLEEGRRFEYSGYAFELVEPWPAGWSYDDECYIEQEEDDYYLVDVFHPHIRVLVIVV